MEANSWEEVKFLKDTAGIPIEKTLGLENNDDGMPSPKTFKENLLVYGFGDTPLEFQLPNPSEIPLIGVPDPNDLDELFVFPPFIDLDSLLDPVFIPASKAMIGKDSCHDKKEASSVSSDKPCTSAELSGRGSTAEQSPEPHERSSVNDETPPLDLSELDMPVETIPENQREPHNQSVEQCKLEPMEHSVPPDDSLVDDESTDLELEDASLISTPELIPSSNSVTSSDPSIIDLTQD